MYCRSCGAQMEDTAKFCAKCGTPVTTAASPKPTTTASGGKRDELTENYYQLLEIPQNADDQQIKDALRKARVQWSKRAGMRGPMGSYSVAVVKRLDEAEKTLLDPTARAEYDKSLLGEPAPADEVRVVSPWVEKARDYIEDQDWEMAKEAVEKAISQDPELRTTWIFAATIYLHLGYYDEADNAARKLLLISPDSLAYEVRGDVLFDSKHRFDEARTQYEKMRDCAQQQGDDDDVKTAQEKIVLCQVAQTLDPKVVDYQNRIESFDTSDGPRVSARNKEAIESFIREGKSLQNEIRRVYGQIDDPSEMFANYRDRDLAQIQQTLDALNSYSAETEGLLKKPATIMAVMAGIALVLAIFSPGFSIFGAIVEVVVLNFVMFGALSWMNRSPNCLGEQIGLMRVFGMYFVFIIALVIAISIGSGIHGAFAS